MTGLFNTTSKAVLGSSCNNIVPEAPRRTAANNPWLEAARCASTTQHDLPVNRSSFVWSRLSRVVLPEGCSTRAASDVCLLLKEPGKNGKNKRVLQRVLRKRGQVRARLAGLAPHKAGAMTALPEYTCWKPDRRTCLGAVVHSWSIPTYTRHAWAVRREHFCFPTVDRMLLHDAWFHIVISHN